MVRQPRLELGPPVLGNREDGTISLRILRKTPDLYENFMNWPPDRIRCRQRLGGLLNYYCRAA